MIVYCKEERIKCKPLCKVKYCRYQRDVLFSGDCTFQRNGSFNKHQSIQSVQFCCSVVSDSLSPQGLQHTRLPCPSPTTGACSNSCLFKSVMLFNHLILCRPVLSIVSVIVQILYSRGALTWGNVSIIILICFLLLSPLIRISTLLTSYDYRLIYSFYPVIIIELSSLSVLSTIIIGASDMVLK